jgi:TetR/AcrR family transcriptional regulator, fatty acid metabolism regulator protein
VAHGLLYHYFSSKEEVLQTVFRETWSAMLETVRSVEESSDSAREQLRKVIAIVLGSWRNDPDLIRVLVREVTRSPQLAGEIQDVEDALSALERIVRRGQEQGQFRTDLDPRLSASIVYGALEEILTGWVLGHLPDRDEDVERAAQTVVLVVCDGLVAAAK